MNDNSAPQGANRPQYAAPGSYAPPKKNHTLRNILLVVLGVSILGCGGCFAMFGMAANEVDKAVKSSEAEDKLPGGPDNPLAIEPGKAFEVNGFNYQAGWEIESNPLDLLEVTGLKVENNRDKKDSALVEIKVWSGKEVVASTDCTTDPIDVGTIVSVSCLSGDALPAEYDKITINDMF